MRVTELISKYKKEFDAVKMADKCAYSKKYAGMDADEIIKYWNKNRDVACDWGDLVHYEIEQYLTEGSLLLDDNIKQWIDKKIKTVVKTETRLYADELDLNGQFDLLAELQDDRLALVDWKTNKEIKQTGYKGESMSFPVDSLQDCNLSHYTLQQGLYSMLMVINGMPQPDVGVIVHINRAMEITEYEVNIHRAVELATLLVEDWQLNEEF